ncbi:MAG: KAP family NTPase [Lachnospiraceae bacterium]|nr:KAP family NTPase [Lachnospiraceae bacterium]
MWRDSETEIDYLDYGYIVDIMTDTINDKKLLPSCIGLYGDWGSGKSSLMHMCIKKLKEQKDDTVCLLFNGWLYESYDDAKTAILSSILDGIKENRTLQGTALEIIRALYQSVDKFKLIKDGIKFGVDLALTGGIGSIANLTMKSVIKKSKKVLGEIDEEAVIKDIKEKLDYKELREDIKEFREKFAQLVDESGIEKLVIFVDELDRCSPDTILDTLEAMRLFLFDGKVAFVIGADERHVSYAIKTKFKDIQGINMDIGKEYQEKLIQYPIRIPSMNKAETEFYILCLLAENELDQQEFGNLLSYLQTKRTERPLEFSIDMAVLKGHDDRIATELNEGLILSKQLSGILSSGLNGNPRQCKRFLNTLDMRQKMAKFKSITLNSQILAKIMEVEYFNPSLFRKMVELLGQNSLKTELKALESGTESGLKALIPWKDDLWVRQWIKIKPPLGDEDLTEYFYFMRSSVDDKTLVDIQKMSEQAKKIFDGLVKHSDRILREAKKIVDKLSLMDQTQILEGLYNDLLSDEKYVNDKFKFFVNWGVLNEQLQITTLSYFEDIQGDKLTISMMPFVESFYTECKDKSRCREIMRRWAEENNKISNEIQKLLD